MTSVPAEQGFELRGERGRVGPMLRELWHSRRLALMLARKDFFVRYRRASLGMLWALGLPLIQAIIYALVLSQFVRFKTPVDFSVFVFSGVLPWSFLNASVVSGTTAIVDGSALATKIYFPRAILPLVSVLSGFYGFLPGVGILLIMTAALGNPLGWELVLMVPATLLLFLLAASFALVLAVGQIYFRDIKHVIGAITLPWFWASGVFYPLGILSKTFRRLIEINPVVGVIQMFRASLGAAAEGWENALWWTGGWIVVLTALAILLYRRYDRVAVDLL